MIIQIGQGEERTLAPPSDVFTNLHYNLVIKSGSNVVYDDAVEGVFEYPLATGTYTLIVDAFNEDNELVASRGRRDPESVTITAGQTTTAKIVLQPVINDIPGTFKYSVTLPSGDGIMYTSAELKLTPETDGPNKGEVTINLVDFLVDPTDENSPDSYTIDLPPGRYTMTIKVESPRQVKGRPLSIFRRETVYIYSNLTTSTVDGAYLFTEEDFTADVLFKGTAKVISVDPDYSWNTWVNENYIPKKVYIQLNGSEAHTEYPDGVKVDDELAHNTETGAYEWELALPSHYVTEGNLASAWFWFEAEHKDDSTKVLVLPSRSINLDSSQGNTEIALTMNVTVPNLPSYVTLETGFDVVQLGGTATAIITPPAKHGLIASSVYVNGSSYSYPSIDNSNGTIKITVSVPNSLDSTYDFIKVNFFHLKGTVSSSSAIYPVKSVEAYRVDAEGNTSPIGTPATVTGGTTNSWEINVPSDYVFWNWSSVEDVNKVYFKVNFGTTASSAILYTHDDRTTTGKSVNTLIPGSPYDTVNLGSIAPFQLTGVKAAIETSTVIVISWDAATWATGGYDVYDSSDGGVNYGSTPVNGSTPVTSTSYRHTGLSISDGATYYYKVIGKRADGTEGAPVYTRVSKLSVNALPTTTSGGLLNSVNVSWSNVSSAAEYYVERRTNGGNWTYLTRTTSTYYSDSNVEMVDDYYEYRVTARADSNISNSATDTSQTSSIVRAPTAQPISWYTGYNYSIGSGETHIYRLSNSGYNSYYAYLNLSSNYGNSYFTVFNSRNKSSRSYTSISGDLFTLYDSGVYSDLILVVEGRWGSDSYYFNINPW